MLSETKCCDLPTQGKIELISQTLILRITAARRVIILPQPALFKRCSPRAHIPGK